MEVQVHCHCEGVIWAAVFRLRVGAGPSLCAGRRKAAETSRPAARFKLLTNGSEALTSRGSSSEAAAHAQSIQPPHGPPEGEHYHPASHLPRSRFCKGPTRTES